MAEIRAFTTGIVTEDLQRKSRFAAKINLKKNQRELYSPPSAEEIIAAGKEPYQKTGCHGEILFLLHVGPQRAFVSRSFSAFGASQEGIGRSLDISVRTVQRHLDALDLDRRQIMQARAEYGRVKLAIEHESSGYQPDQTLQLLKGNEGYQLAERHIAGKQWFSHPISEESFTDYYSKYWIYRPNIYEEPFKLCSMAAARREFRKKMGIEEPKPKKRIAVVEPIQEPEQEIISRGGYSYANKAYSSKGIAVQMYQSAKGGRPGKNDIKISSGTTPD